MSRKVTSLISGTSTREWRRIAKGIVRRIAPDWAKPIYRRLRARASPAPSAKKVPPKKNSVTLAEHARSQRWQIDPVTRTFLESLERTVRKRKCGSICICGSVESGRLGIVMADAFPHSKILFLSPEDVAAQENPNGLTIKTFRSDEDVHTFMTAHGPFDIFIDATVAPQNVHGQLMRHFCFHVKRGGAFIVRSFQAPPKTEADNTESLWQLVARLVDHGQQPTGKLTQRQQDEQELSLAIGDVIVTDELLLVTNKFAALAKMRDDEFNPVLELRPELGRVVETRPGATYESRCDIRANDHRWDARFAASYTTPAVSLREYRNVLCLPHQIAIKDGILLPDTFRHYFRPRLANRYLGDISHYFARPKEALRPAQVMSGAYFYLDSEWPHHFGHLVTEQLSRLWAWPTAKKLHPHLKALIPLPKGKTELADFQVAILAATGIEPKDLATPCGPVRVETLLAGTPMLCNPKYLHPDIAEVWGRTGRALIASAPERCYPARLFSSRRPKYKRKCHNVTDVEEVFAGFGFEIVYPEDYGPAEQAAMFNRAEIVAGFAGSALFNLAFCQTPKRVIMISSASYTARNEYMISSVLGHTCDVIWCDADVEQPIHGWDVAAFNSGFSFDFEQNGEYSKNILCEVTGPSV